MGSGGAAPPLKTVPGRDTVPVISYPTTIGKGGRPRPHLTTKPFSPFQCCASVLSWAWPLGCQETGTQNVKPEARTWCHTESGVPTPGTAHGMSATGATCDGRPPHAPPIANNTASTNLFSLTHHPTLPILTDRA